MGEPNPTHGPDDPAQQIRCDYCDVPLFVTTGALVDAKGGRVCQGGGMTHDHRNIMGAAGGIGATYAEAQRGDGGNRLILHPNQGPPYGT